ncbi:zinc finger protein 184-like, partial [Mizuhopecten yessoensis]
KKSSHDKNKKKPSYDKNNNLTSEKHKKWNDTEKNTIPSVTITSFCSGKDSNGNKTFVSNFLLAEQNQNQSSWKRHSSKRKRFKSDQRSKNIKRPDSSDTKSCNLTTMIKRRKYCSSVTSREHQSSSGSSLGRPDKFLEEESDASDKDRFFSSVRNPLLLVKDCQSEWQSDRKEEASSDNGSSSESTKSSDCNVGGSEDLEDFSGNPDSSPKPLKCKHCSKTFRRRFNLSRHMLIHEGNGPYQCDICNKNCQSRGDLVKHLTVHTGDHPFQCDICQKSFTQKVNLKRHMATHLDKDRDTPESLTNCFRCGICDKGFTQKTHMERHRRLHTGEKRYKCHICSEQFFESHHLKRHLMKHENGKIMKCTVCKKKFTRRLEYSRHLRTHNQFKDYRLYTCDTCDRGYDTRHGLVKHMLIHTREKPFNCTVCNKSFRCKDSFREHNKGIKHKSRLLKFERRQYN